MRLTEKDNQGNWCLRGVPWEGLNTGAVISNKTSELLYRALLELLEYEESGLTPEEIMDGKVLTGWIPVTEQLPRTTRTVLVQDAEGVMRTAWYGANGKKWRTNDSLRQCCHVVAWMPLPDLYRPDGQEADAEAGECADAPVMQSAT